MSLELYSIAPTLFTADGRAVDEGAIAHAIEWMVDQGIDRFLLTGSYGEFQSLTDQERVDVVRAARAVDGVRSVMACAAQPSTDATARLAARLLDEGADAVMISPPLACECTSADVLRHFKELSRRVSGELVVYNNPVFGVDLSATELEAIAALPGIVAIKQGTLSLRGLADSISAVHARAAGVRVLAASDLTAVAALAAGADGLTSTNSWAFPRAVVALVGAAERSDWESARRIAAALAPYFKVVRALGQPRTVKAAMQLRGLDGTDAVRHPYAALDQTERQVLQSALSRADVALASQSYRQEEWARSG